MRKKIVSIFCLVVMLLSTLAMSACNFFTIDDERNLNLTVASVNTGDRTTDIKKRDLMTMYISQSYYYMYNYSMTADQVLEMFLQQLINKAIIVQEAERTLNSKNSTFRTKINHSSEKFLTNEELYTIVDTVHKYINEYLDSYENSILGIETTTPDTTNTRVVPKFEEEEKEEFVENEADITKIDKDSTSTRKKAFSKMEKALKESYSSYDKMYEEQIIEEIENKVVEKWQNQLKNSREVTVAELESRYNELLAAEKESYTYSLSNYDTKLSAISSSAFAVYNPKVGYGFVYNLLLSFDDYQTVQLNQLKSRYQEGRISKAQYETERRQLLNNITVKDLRESWIAAEYEYNFEDKQFGTDYVKNNTSLPFMGDVKYTYEKDGVEQEPLINQKPEKGQTGGTYTFENLAEFNMSEFMAKFDEWMGSSTTNYTSGSKEYDKLNYYAHGKVDEGINALPAARVMFKDLMFAFSGDDSDSALNAYNGYVSSPKPADNASETFVTEFANAARDVVSDGAGSYIVVGTDFGYHIIYCLESISKDTMETEKKFKEEEMNTFGTFSYKFKQTIVSVVQSNYMSQTQTELLNNYKDKDGVVTVYKSRYKDLLG